ncbi:MAG: ECF transporter S component [Clostridia bacterium]|nr:ECF transporter S component [Clostridia bacterium]
MNKSRNQVVKLVAAAMLCAISIILVYLVHFPIFAAAPFLEYDPADIPILIGSFLFGPVTGLIMTVVTSIIQALTVSASSGWIGCLMHVFATGSFVIASGLIYRGKKTLKRAIIALLVGVVAQVVAMVIWNLIFTPIFMGTPVNVVLQLMLPAILPFNLIKAGVNAVLTFVLYKSVSKAVSKFLLT